MVGNRLRLRSAAGLTAGCGLLVAVVQANAVNPAESSRAGVSGTVRIGSSVPKDAPIDMGGHPYCAEANGASPTDRAVTVNSNGTIAGAVVFVLENVPATSPATPEDPVILDQENCFYTPRVLALRTGQPLIVRNSDATLHNVHAFADINRGFNIGQPLRGIQATRRFDRPEVGIDVRCDIHGWMYAGIAVFDHAYFTVTGPDGAFTLDGLPPGQYTLAAWHPALGQQTSEVTVGADGVEVEFVL